MLGKTYPTQRYSNSNGQVRDFLFFLKADNEFVEFKLEFEMFSQLGFKIKRNDSQLVL